MWYTTQIQVQIQMLFPYHIHLVRERKSPFGSIDLQNTVIYSCPKLLECHIELDVPVYRLPGLDLTLG